MAVSLRWAGYDCCTPRAVSALRYGTQLFLKARRAVYH